MRSKYNGDIMAIRSIEDTIRATKKYTKGAFLKPAKHPIQGEEFPSKVVTEYYEVYPDMEIGWDMSIIDATFWLAGETPHIDVIFRYNYSNNRAEMIVHGSNGVVKMLKDGIPDFSRELSKVSNGGRH